MSNNNNTNNSSHPQDEIQTQNILCLPKSSSETNLRALFTTDLPTEYESISRPASDDEKSDHSRSAVGVIGVCAMDVKTSSKPMQYVISKLAEVGWKIVVFGDDMILNQPIENWPTVDAMIGFFSTGFPLKKAIKYTELHPTTFYINSLASQRLILDRRLIYSVLERNCIPVLPYLVVSRDGPSTVVETTSNSTITPQIATMSTNMHSSGGVLTNSFDENLLEEYEDYIVLNGAKLEKPFVEKPVNAEDHNIYIYFHSRDGGGSVRLFRKIGNCSSARSEVSRIRREGSFIYEKFIQSKDFRDVKCYTIGSEYVYAESRKAPHLDGKVERDSEGKEIRYKVKLTSEEKLIAYRIVKAFDQRLCGFDILRDAHTDKTYVCDVNGWSFVKGNYKFYDTVARVFNQICRDGMVGKGLQTIALTRKQVLRGVVGVFRHGDRTPKQKLKLKTSHPVFVGFSEPNTDLKYRSQKYPEKIKQILEQVEQVTSLVDFKDFDLLLDVIRGVFGPIKIQIKPLEHEVVNEEVIVTKTLFIVKWGGILTHAGIQQAYDTGVEMTTAILPADPDERKKFQETTQIFTNSEARVYRTGVEFGKGFMGLPKGVEFPASRITNNHEMSRVLADIVSGKELIELMKQKLYLIMHLNETKAYSYPGLKKVEQPLKTCQEIYQLMKILELQQSRISVEVKTELCAREPVELFTQRWSRLRNAFYKAQNEFDITKVPEIFDYITYDFVHNQEFLPGHDLYPLYKKAEYAGRFLISGEYGLSPLDKLNIGALIATPLLDKIYHDLLESTKNPYQTRFYFSSESHLHSLRNILLHSGVGDFLHLIEPVELNYLTHIIFRLIENVGETNPQKRFFIEVLFSAGTSKNPFSHTLDHVQRFAPRVCINNSLKLSHIKECVDTCQKIAKELNPKKKLSKSFGTNSSSGIINNNNPTNPISNNSNNNNTNSNPNSNANSTTNSPATTRLHQK